MAIASPEIPMSATFAPTRLAPAERQGDERLQLLSSILADRRWPCPPAVRLQLLTLLSSVARTGRADECAWITLSEEIARYLHYRKTGLLEEPPLDWHRSGREHRCG